MLQHFDDDVEVGSVHWVLIPALLKHSPVLCWTIRWNLAHVGPCLLRNDRGHDLVGA